MKTIPTGFTLIETLIAVLLLSTAIAGPLTIASKGLNASLIAKDQVSAFFLAQDAVEYVRFVRDSNKLGGVDWLSGLGECTSADGSVSCYLDATNNNPELPMPCTGACPVLMYNPATYRFSYTGTPTPQRFVRTVRITTPVGSNADEAALSVVVEWTGSGGVVRNVSVREELFDW